MVKSIVVVDGLLVRRADLRLAGFVFVLESLSLLDELLVELSILLADVEAVLKLLLSCLNEFDFLNLFDLFEYCSV